MSRIGKNPISIPDGVKIAIDKIDDREKITVRGEKGELEYVTNSGISVEIDGNQLIVVRKDDSKPLRALHGLSRALLNNMVEGVSKGYLRELHVVGTGYNAEMKGNWLRLALGYSHDILFHIPEHVQVETEAVPRGRGRRIDIQSIIRVRGISKEAVGSIAAEIRRCRPPENYKGKGIRYSDEEVQIKAGKTGAK